VPPKAVLITGCSSGIGHATAEKLAADGWKMYATARRPETIDDLKQRGCETLALDVTDEASMQAAVDHVTEAEGAVGVLVNNAGYSEAFSDALRFESRGFGVDVILIEPGLITTGFADVASGSVTHADEGPYAHFNKRVARLTETAYAGPMSKLGAGPEAVANTIAKVLKSGRPKARYPVTLSAHLMINQRRFTPDQIWDLMMRTQYPTPNP
jgi:NADP-dependent 3-hydroxy acid dehydrogenase YdfG